MFWARDINVSGGFRFVVDTVFVVLGIWAEPPELERGPGCIPSPLRGKCWEVVC